MNFATGQRAVLGVDGCPAGWVGALVCGDSVELLVADVIESLVRLARKHADVAVVAIDIPIGLPDTGPREADRLARTRLARHRKSSVFPTPCREACESMTWAEANATNKQVTGKGLSHQGFGLVRKIMDVDGYLAGGPEDLSLIEAHPEVCLAAMTGATVPDSKKTPAGRRARRAVLASAGIAAPSRHPRGTAEDDVLDACAVAWTARRYATGAAESLPDPPERFSDGLPAAIWV